MWSNLFDSVCGGRIVLCKFKISSKNFDKKKLGFIVFMDNP